VLIPPESGIREEPRPGWTGGRYDWMRTVLKADHGKQLYRKRSAMIEPVLGHTKHNRSANRFHRRGRTAVRTEWRLLMATHNLTKLYRHQIASVCGPEPALTRWRSPISSRRPALRRHRSPPRATPKRLCATASDKRSSLARTQARPRAFPIGTAAAAVTTRPQRSFFVIAKR
jgi:hypothetical protein